MVYWNWRITRDGIIRFSLVLLTLSFSYRNLAWLNSLFLPQLPVGYILFSISGIFTLRHIYRTLRWYRTWLNGKRYQKYEKLIMHICLYLVVISVVLSVPTNIDSIDDSIFPNIETNKILDTFSPLSQSSPQDTIQDNSMQEDYVSPTRSNPKTYNIKDFSIIYFVQPYENQAKYQSVAELMFVNTNTTVSDSQKITVNYIAATDSYNTPIYGFDNFILPWSVVLKPYEKSYFPIYFRALDTTKPFTITISIESNGNKDVIDLSF